MGLLRQHRRSPRHRVHTGPVRAEGTRDSDAELVPSRNRCDGAARTISSPQPAKIVALSTSLRSHRQ